MREIESERERERESARERESEREREIHARNITKAKIGNKRNQRWNSQNFLRQSYDHS